VSYFLPVPCFLSLSLSRLTVAVSIGLSLALRRRCCFRSRAPFARSLPSYWDTSFRDMVSDDDVEKARDLEPTTATASTADSEKVEAGKVAEGAYGEPDSDHQEVEFMDEGHLDDLARQHVSVNSQQETS
jgi:hypothetical protein